MFLKVKNALFTGNWNKNMLDMDRFKGCKICKFTYKAWNVHSWEIRVLWIQMVSVTCMQNFGTLFAIFMIKSL